MPANQSSFSASIAGDGTIVADNAQPRASYDQLRALLEIQHDLIRAAHRGVEKSGVLCLAFDLGSADRVAKHWVKTREGLINAATIGRHRGCDLCLPRDPTLSLRHLCLIVHPYAGRARERVSFRVTDLRTGVAFADCFGQRLEGVVADGAALITLGRYAVLLLPTGDGTRVPRSKDDAWNLLADPVYLDPGTQLAQGAHGATSEAMNRTIFSVIGGPVRAGGHMLLAQEEPIGALEVSTDERTAQVFVGARSAKKGLLLGCYERCDNASLSHLEHSAISRVHLLVVEHDGILYAIDTASTNGTFVQQPDRRVRARMVKLSPGLELSLADNRARVRWVEL